MEQPVTKALGLDVNFSQTWELGILSGVYLVCA